MHTKLAIALLGAAALPLIAPAQQLHGPLMNIPVPTTITSGGRSPFALATHRGPIARYHRSGSTLASPYLYPDYSYLDYSAEPAAEAAPQVVVVQIPTAAEPPVKETKASPLLIEWQVDRYVRVSDTDSNAGTTTDAQSDRTEPSSPKPTAPMSNKRPQTIEPTPADLAPVVLVYRDGRREQIRDYTIADGIIYARGDYWTDGYWTKKIQLAALNIPASMKASQDRGARFVLPASANEVVTRP